MPRLYPLLLAAVALAACTPAEERVGIELSPCHLEGLSSRALCGSYRVFEDRAAGSGRRIDLYVAVIPALKRSAADPVVFLAGGPGQSATKVAQHVLPSLHTLRRHRDIVFVDLRGTGESHPLDCELEQEDDLAAKFEVEFPLDKLEACARDLDADPSKYTTDSAIRDLDEVRQALGYRQLNLVGGSYGTRAALAYARAFPDRVRTMVLDGVAPPQMRLFLDFLSDGQRALDRLEQDCKDDVGCASAFPTFGADLAALLEELEEHPAEISVRHPRADEPLELTIERSAFTAALRFILYSPRLMQLTPLMVQQARSGDWAPFIAQAIPMAEQVDESLSIGLLLSVACAEDAPRITEEEKAKLGAHSFLGTFLVDEFQKACAVWPHAIADPALSQPVTSNAPTLLLSGEMDPVTPPHWAETALQTLPRGRHGVAPGQSHGVLSFGCAPRLVTEFVETGTADGLDLECLRRARRSPFFVDRLGPAAPGDNR